MLQISEIMLVFACITTGNELCKMAYPGTVVVRGCPDVSHLRDIAQCVWVDACPRQVCANEIAEVAALKARIANGLGTW